MFEACTEKTDPPNLLFLSCITDSLGGCPSCSYKYISVPEILLSGGPPDRGGSWRNRGGGGQRRTNGKARQDWRDNGTRPWERGGHTGGHYIDLHLNFYQNLHGRGTQNVNHRPNSPRVQSHQNRGQHRLAPR